MDIDIKSRRIELDLSQFELAKKIGVSVMSIQKWERGVTTPKPENQKKLKEVLENE